MTVILSLRVYAIYNKSKHVLAFLVILMLVSISVNVAQMSGVLCTVECLLNYITCGLHSGSLASAVENLSPGNSFVLPYVPFGENSNIPFLSCLYGSQPIAGIAWATTMVIESVLFTMVLVKSREKGHANLISHTSSARFDLYTFLARDSSIYYGM